MTIHILPIVRAVPLSIVETRALFLVREAASIGATKSPTFAAIVEQLARSTNAAISNEAQRLKATLR